MPPSPEQSFAHLRAAFDATAAAQEIRAELGLADGELTLVFAGQEEVEPERMAEAFVGELVTAGVAWDELRVLAGLDQAGLERRRVALDTALARLRTLLVEFHSYMSGGLPWVFPGGTPAWRERGLAIYRFPKRAAVDVTPEGSSLRIRFHAGELGKVTSSGFYAPTRVEGDFRATLVYELGRWEPGPEAASFALFAQDEPSQLRYYAQRRSAGGGPHELLANFTNTVFSEPLVARERSGAFRLERDGRSVRIAHREGGVWTELATHAGDPPNDVIFGSKIWSSATAGVLEAVILDLTIEGRLTAEQLPPVPVRPDPRS